MNKKAIRDLLPLVAICLIAAMLLAVFNQIVWLPKRAPSCLRLPSPLRQ